jgi:hypothetical protein
MPEIAGRGSRQQEGLAEAATAGTRELGGGGGAGHGGGSSLEEGGAAAVESGRIG